MAEKKKKTKKIVSKSKTRINTIVKQKSKLKATKEDTKNKQEYTFRWYLELFNYNYLKDHPITFAFVIVVFALIIYLLVLLVKNFSSFKLGVYILKIIFLLLIFIIIKKIGDKYNF
ncbi:MAG: hypothetical protein V1824_04500 [archaeon]